MNWDEYKDVIDFSPLKSLMNERGLSLRGVADLAGTKDYLIGNYISKKTFPNTEALAKLCAALQCSVDKVVKFTGYDVKDSYKIPWDGYGKPRWNKLTYEPLRMLFQGVYNENWQKKLIEFYDIIPRPELSEAQEAHIKKRIESVKNYWKEKAKEEGRGPIETKRKQTGLREECRADIGANRAIPLPRLYDICKALHCTPDWVMTYN